MELHRSRLAVALALVAIVFPTTFSAPAPRSSCTPVCRQSQVSKISYQEGKSYTYGFETEVITQVLGSTDEQAKIKVKGQAVIAAQSPCDFILTVQQVAIQNPSGQAISRVDDIEGSSLRFSYQDGQVESVCVAEDDPTWSSNVKRAIISMLTNTAEIAVGDVSTETDISGRCPTTYSVSGDKYVKTRDLNSCTKRDGGATVFLGVAYDVPSKYNSMSVIDSALECTQDLKDGVFQHVQCIESHKVPFLSTQSTGIHTEIKSSLNLVSSTNGITKSSKITTKPSSILYDHSEIQDGTRQKATATKSVDFLKKICQEIEDGAVSSKVPGLYLQLIKTLKTVRKEDVKQMYEKITSGSMCSKATEKLEKIFLDAAATSGSDGSIAFLSEIITKDEVGCHTKTLFLTNAIFAPHPDVGALAALSSLISKTDIEAKYLLTASGVGHQYCRMTNEDCASNREYVALVNKIAQHVRPSVTDEEGLRKVVAALQALGNLDQLTPEAVTAISSIIDDKTAPERLKVRALDAFRRNPCQQQLKQKAIRVFGDNKESSHVRIQAYLTLSKCVEQDDVSTIQTILNAEQSSQVGSFVSSHVENVLETASPSKQGVKNVFRQLTIPEGLSKDMRKFSRNSEYSTFLPNLNVGGSLDGNLIFSQDSYLPRMTNANFTVDAFGRSYNLLELGVYAEDFEHLIEKYFGPAGKIRQTDLENLISKGSAKLSQLVEGIRNRFKRELKVDASQNEIDFIRDQVDIEERVGDHGVGDVYIRVMGTSMLVESFSETNLREGSLAKKFRTGFEKMLEGAKDTKFDLTHPVIFIDEELVLPTFAGLPLNLEIEGTSIVSMQMNGNVDITSLFRAAPSDMRAKFVPSAATLLKSRMTVGAGPVESGLQLEGKVHSAAGVDVKVVKEDGKFEVRFNLPQERTQIIDVRSDLYWIEQPQDSMEKKTQVQSKLTTKSLANNECLTAFSNFLGLKFCTDMKIPQVSRQAPFPVLNGQAVFSLSVEKSESSMEGYYLKVERDTQNDGNFGFGFLLDTPGSRTNRKVSASLKATQYKSTTPEYVFKLDSPWTKLDVDYKRAFTDELKGVELKIVSDGEAYNGKLQLKKVQAGSVSKYEPIVQYSFPGGRPVKLIEGQVLRVQGQGKVEIDLRTAGPFRQLRGSVKGTIEVPEKADGFEVKAKNLEFASEVVGKIAFDGHVMKEKQVFDTKVHTKYGQEKQHTFEFETKLGKPKHGHYEFKTKTRSSRRSFLNFDVSGEVSKEGHTYKSELTYTRGVEEPKVHFTHKIKTTIESPKEFEIFHESSLKHPGFNVDMYSKIDSKAAPGQARHAEAIFNVNSFKSNARYDSDGKNFLDYVFKSTAEYGGKTYEFTETSVKASDHKQNFKSKLSVTPGFWYHANTDVTYKFEKSDMESTLSTTITSDTFADPIVFKSGVRGKSDGYHALMKLDMKGNNYVDFTTQFKHAKGSTPATFTSKAFVLNYLDSKLSQTISRSQCDMQLDIKWVPTGRKIEARSKLTNSGDVYNLNSDLKWDAERDPSKSASIKSVTNLSFSKLQCDSKNEITVEGKLAKLNLKGQHMKEWFNGEDNLEVDYTSPSGKTYNLATVLNLENKLKVKGGKMNVKVTLPGEKPYDFTFENRVSNINPREATFELVTDMKFDYKGEKDVSFHGELGSALPGNYRRNTGKIEIGGSVIQEPISGTFKADIKKGKWAVSADGKRGALNSDFDVILDYDVWSPKKTFDLKYTVNTPFDSVKSLEGVHKFGVLYNSLKNFEYTEEGSISLNHGSPAQWKYLTSVLSNEVKFLSEYAQDGRSVYLISADGKVTSKKLISDIQLTYREEKSFLNIDIDHQLPTFFGVVLKGAIPSTSFELKTTHQKSSDGIYETDILAKTANELAFRVTNKLEFTPTKKSIDLVVSAAEEPARRLYLLVNQASNDKYNVETLLKWGDGNKFLSTKGDIGRSSEGFEANLLLDSPELRLNKMNVKLAKKSQSGRHAVTLKVLESNKDKFSAIFDYGSTLERSGAQKVYDGSVTIKGDGSKSPMDINLNGKFRLEDTSLARSRGDEEDGRQFRGTFEVGKSGAPIKGTAVLKTSDKEKRAQVSLCNEERGRCRSGDAHLRHQSEANGDVEYSLRIVAETDAGGQKSITGVSIITAKTENGRQMDHTVKLILNHQNSDPIGYRFYRKDGHEFGAELLLPERIIATVLDCQHPGPTDVKLDLSFFIDKSRQPTRKISLILNTERHKEQLGRDIEFIFRHPDVGKDLKVHTKYSIAGEAFEVKTVLDIFKANSEIVLAYKALKESSDIGNLYKTQWSVISKGQSINFGGKSEISARNGQLSYKQELHYENRDKETKTAKIETLLSMNRMSFEVKGHSGKLISLISTFEDQATGYEYRQEVLFPGMEDARIFQAILTTVSPRKAQLKTYTANSPAGIYYEAIVGFKTQDHFVVGLYDHESSGQKTLADFNLALNNNRVLSIKTNFEKENFKSVWAKVQARVSRNGKNLKELASSAFDEAVKELNFVATNVIKSAPKVKAALTAATNQWADLVVELDAHDDTKIVVEQIQLAKGFFKTFVRFMVGVTKAARRMAYTFAAIIKEQLEQLPNLLGDYTSGAPYTMDDLKRCFESFVTALTDCARNSVKLLGQTAERISASMPEIIKCINWALDKTSDINDAIRSLLETTLDQAAIWWRSIRSFTKDFIDHDLVRMFIKDTVNVAQMILSELIEETKQYAVSFKNYIINVIPEADFQEIVQLTAEYVEKKAKNVQVDDAVAIKEIYEKVIKLVKKVSAKFFSVDSSEGGFNLSVMLPNAVDSLSDVLKSFGQFSFPSPPVVQYNLPSYRFGITEVINKLRHGACVNEFVPPYDAYGLVIGSQFYKTFDGQFFRFDGSCQYLLASDFEDGNFTIAVDYERTGSNVARAIIVKDATDTIAIKSDNTVVVNGQTYTATDIDAQHPKTEHFKIERSNNWIVVTGDKGVKVGCSSLHDVCGVKVNGFYHGKVLGLLGKFNQEKFDDLTTAEGQIAENVNQFTESWKLEKQCTERPVITMPVITSEASTACSDALESRSSSLRPCYGVVAPQDYQRACERLSSSPGYTVSKAVCTASAGYAKACYLSYAKVELPSECRQL